MKRKMNYIIFSANYLPNLGGVERYTYNLAKQLIAKGNQVTVITSNTDKYLSYEEIEGIKVYRLPCINLLKGRFPISKFNREYIRLMKQVKKERYDLCIVNTRFYIHSLCGVVFGKQYSSKTIVIEHGTNHFTINNKWFDAMGHVYEHVITKLVKLNCKNFYGVSQACNDWLTHYDITAKGVLYNAIDLSDIKYIMNENKEYYRKKLDIPSDAILITYTGRLVKEKGIEKLIEAIKIVNQSNSNVYLAIAGDGDLMEAVKKLESRYIHVLGRLGFDEIVGLLKQSDVFCLPTDYPEGFPTSVIEAAACKCFIITTKSGGSNELILNTQYGVILEENTSKEIAKHIQFITTNRNYSYNAIELSYTQCVENFTWDIVSDKVIELVE